MRPQPRIPFVVGSLAFLAAARLHAASGGPDPAGYTWADSDEPNVSALPPNVPTITDLRALGYQGDETLIQINLPAAAFPTGFPFYGQSYTRFWLSSNGWLSFVDPAGNPAPTSTTQPAAGTPEATIAFLWDDWTLEGTGSYADGGTVSTGDGYSMFLRFYRKGDSGTPIGVYVTMYRTGQIQVIYQSGTNKKAATTNVGIEDQTGTVGLPYMRAGQPENGANFRDGYAVWFYPKGNLNCTTGVTPVTCPQPSTPYSNATGTNAVTTYNCAAGTWNGNEKVFSLNLARASNLDIQLSNTGPRNPRLFLIRPSCSELTGCVAGGTPTVTQQFVMPGTWYIVVDAPTAGDNGNFNLTVGCTDAVTSLPCNTTLVAESVPAAGILTSWSCAPGLSGGEKVYQVDLPQAATLVASISAKSNPSLEVLVSDPNTFTTTAPTCLAADLNQIKMWNAGPGSFYVSVDGTGAGSYNLDIQCERRLNCSTPGSVLDLANPTPVVGNTTGRPNNVETYYCQDSAYGQGPLEAGGYTGGEDVYSFTVASTSLVSFLFSPANPDMRALILGDCYEGSCVMEGGCAETLPPGNYRLVIDGVNGAQGPYSITPLVLPLQTYNPWTGCDECNAPRCTHTAAEISNRQWHFDSGTFCGTGCDFSLFAVVECGSEFHIPFYDCETGHMSVFDVFRQQYVNLTATNELAANPALPAACRLTSTGTNVQWEDNTCRRIPCAQGPAQCGGGNDCRTNNVVMDVSFEGTPNVCGVYRLDFKNWGGYEWYAYANCTADRTPQYDLYANLCAAISAYRPLPEIGISSATLDNSACTVGQVSGTITVENVGCLPAANAEIVLDQAPPLPSNPVTITLNMAQGSTQVVPWSYTPSTVPARLVFTVDPSNGVVECSENSGSTVSCGFNSVLQRSYALNACSPPCSTRADAGPDLATCEGAPVTLDGSASSLACSLGTPQYRWEDRAGNPVPGCDWGGLATCSVPAVSLASGANDFTLRTRCLNDSPPCETTDPVVVTVTANVAPPSLGNTVLGARRGADVEFRWAPLTGSPITAYRVYKDAARNVPVATRSKIFDVPISTTLVTELAGVPNAPAMAYYQFVAASCLGDLESPY